MGSRDEKFIDSILSSNKELLFEAASRMSPDYSTMAEVLYSFTTDSIFLEYTPEKVNSMLEEGGGSIESIVIKEKIKRLVIDSITSFELLFDDDLKKREAALSLFNMLRKWGCTSLLTYEGDSLKDKAVASRTLEFESDSIILLYFIRTKNQRDRFLEVLKMRGTEHSRKIYAFSMDKHGIVLSKKPCSENIGI